MSPGLGEIYEPRAHIEEIRRALDEDLEALSAVVRVPALLHQTVNGRMITQQIILMGIDDQTYSHVSDFTPYLLNEQNRKQPDFQLKKGGYDGRLGEVGWPYRTQKAEFEREQRRLLEAAYGSKVTQAQPEVKAEGQEESEFAFVPIPVSPPVLSTDAESGNLQQVAGDSAMPQATDPFKAVRESEHTQIFDGVGQSKVSRSGDWGCARCLHQRARGRHPDHVADRRFPSSAHLRAVYGRRLLRIKDA